MKRQRVREFKFFFSLSNMHFCSTDFDFFFFLQVTIDDLIPGSRYKFRIKSENNYGISNPGDESDPFDVGGVTSDRSVKSCFIRFVF